LFFQAGLLINHFTAFLPVKNLERKMNLGTETRIERHMSYKFFFTVMFACLLSLANQTCCFATNVTLQWDANTDSDLAGYRVYYQADSSTQPFKGTGATPTLISKTATTATISGLSSVHGYYFAVTAYNTAGVESAYSNLVSVPVLQAPSVPTISAPTGTGKTTTPTFTLNAVDGASGYVIWLQNFTTGTGGPISFTAAQGGTTCAAGSGVCSFTLASSLVSGNSYGWGAAAQNTAGQGSWSSALNFVVGSSLTTAPAISAPSGTGVATTAAFKLTAVAGATSYVVWLQDYTTGTGGPITFTSSSGGSTCTTAGGACSFIPSTPFTSGHLYGWGAAAKNAAGQGPWSSAFNFIVGGIPAAPVISAPSGTGVATTPTFKLTAVPGATGYVIWLQNYTTATGAPISFTAAQGGTACAAGSGVCSFTMATPLVSTNSYGWGAAAQNAAGQGPWSSGLNFVVQ
jgi:hypothetical protein